MSVVAWDGKYVAADRQGTSGNLICVCRKLMKIRGYGVGFIGRADTGALMAEWFREGAKVSNFPCDVQQSDSGATLIVVGRVKAWEICEYPLFEEVRDPFWAWGTGREVALGAMAMGVDAKTAVETAMRFDVNCGVGMDFLECKKLSVRGVKVK